MDSKKFQRTKIDFQRAKLSFARTKVTSGVDEHANKAANLLARGRKNRNAVPAAAKNGGGMPAGLTFLGEGPIAEVASFLDPVQARAGIEEWVRNLRLAETGDAVTNLIDPTSEDSEGLTKIDIEIGANLQFTFQNLPSYNGKPCPALVQEYMRVVVGLMEKFYQQQEGDISLRGRQIQLVLWCQRIESPENGLSPPFTVQGNPDDAIVVSTHYVVSLGNSPTLRIGFQDLVDDAKSDFFHEIRQDSLTLWRNDLLAHRIETEGTGTALLLSIGLVDPHQVFTN